MFDFAIFDMPWWGWVAVAFVVICYGLQNDKVGKAIVLSVCYGLMGTGLFGIWSSGIPQATVSSFAQHVARIQVEEVRVAKIRKEGQEQVFATVCPDYFELNWPSRQISHLRWCSEYGDRL
jgi:hypothetical protein